MGSFGVRLQFSMEMRDPLPAAKPVEPAQSSTTTSKVTEVRTGLVAQVPVTEFPVDAMGEVRYQQVLEKICGGRTPVGVDLLLPARCVPDEDDGVRVEIDGAPVGSLTSDVAWVYRMTIAGASECRARIRRRPGSWTRRPGPFRRAARSRAPEGWRGARGTAPAPCACLLSRDHRRVEPPARTPADHGQANGGITRLGAVLHGPARAGRCWLRERARRDRGHAGWGISGAWTPADTGRQRMPRPRCRRASVRLTARMDGGATPSTSASTGGCARIPKSEPPESLRAGPGRVGDS